MIFDLGINFHPKNFQISIVRFILSYNPKLFFICPQLIQKNQEKHCKNHSFALNATSIHLMPFENKNKEAFSRPVFVIVISLHRFRNCRFCWFVQPFVSYIYVLYRQRLLPLLLRSHSTVAAVAAVSPFVWFAFFVWMCMRLPLCFDICSPCMCIMYVYQSVLLLLRRPSFVEILFRFSQALCHICVYVSHERMSVCLRKSNDAA